DAEGDTVEEAADQIDEMRGLVGEGEEVLDQQHRRNGYRSEDDGKLYARSVEGGNLLRVSAATGPADQPADGEQRAPAEGDERKEDGARQRACGQILHPHL